jgi:hypothetical protein
MPLVADRPYWGYNPGDRCTCCDEYIPVVAARCLFCGEPRGSSLPPLRRDAEPHRAGLLRFLSTVSVVTGAVGIPVSVVAGIITWVMANNDLAKMKEGVMDRTGMLRTRQCRDTALIGAVLGVTIGAVWLLLFLPLLRH